ncbi:MAG: RagB/SusD family nutrient uptake outer membrane protein [Bacteroidales bacterium]|nr:RagB/SusD family nutrient uptake outer membrane protein [Bacteroidales bacterium]
MKYRQTFILLGLLFFCACDMKEKPTSFVNRTNYYGNETQCISALNACYQPLASIYVPNYMLAVEACTDIWYSQSSTVDAVLDVTPAKPQVGATIWRQGYLGVMRCNECIECIGSSKLPAEQKDPLVAEARVLRALYYYNLTCFFGGVPFYKEMVADDQTLMRIRQLPRTDPNVIRADLYNDLRDNAIPFFTDENGRKVRASEAKSQRVGYALGLMLMAKFALWNEDYDLALQPLKDLEALYGAFSEERYPLDQVMWRYKNTLESILEIQHDWSTNGVQYAGQVANIMTPSNSPSLTDPSIRLFDGVELPEIGNQVTSWAALRANNIFGIFRPATGTTKTENTGTRTAMFNPLPLTYSDEYDTQDGRYYTCFDMDAIAKGEIRGEKIDRRVYMTLGLGNLASGEVFNLTKRYGVGWAGPKFWCPHEVQAYDSNNYKIFRYADALLMMAECYIAKEDADEAMRYMNMVRQRAGVDPVTNFTGFEALTAVLRCERARELGGEFQRKFDLVRWGVWYEQTRDNTNNSGLKARIKRCHRFYPIPDVQCALSGRVLANDEYVAEGM